MAKKKRKEEEEPKYEFVPPDFDEKSFLEKDILGTKALLVATLCAIIAGIVAYLLTDVSIYLGGVVILAIAILLRWIYPVFHLKSVENRTQLGNVMIVLLLGLGVWIMLLNTPFSDQIPPEVTSQSVTFHTTAGWTRYVSDTSTPIHSGDLVNITIIARDNGQIGSVTISVHPSGSSSSFVPMNATSAKGGYEYLNTYSITGATAVPYTYTINVTDVAGHKTTVNGSFIVNPSP